MLRLVQAFALAAGLVGVSLLVIQLAVLHKVCPLCLIVDLSAIGMATAAAGRLPVRC